MGYKNVKSIYTTITLKLVYTLEFQIEGEGEINGEAGKFRPK